MLVEWLAAAAVLILFLALLPRVLTRAKRSRRTTGASGVWIALGIAVSMIFDPKAAQAMEIVERTDEREDEESGDGPG